MFIQPKTRIIGMNVNKVGLMECVMYFILTSITRSLTLASFLGLFLNSFICLCSSFSSSLRSFIRLWSVKNFIASVIIIETINERINIESAGWNDNVHPSNVSNTIQFKKHMWYIKFWAEENQLFRISNNKPI